MTETPPSTRVKALGAGAIFLISLAFLGMIVGGLVATRVFYSSNMGWDQIADAIGGSFVGILAALIIGAIIVGRISNRVRLIGTGIALIVAALGIVYLRSTPVNVRPPQDRAIIPPLVEPFSLQFGTADPLEGPRQIADDLPWETLRIGSNLSFDYVLVAEPNTLCLAPGSLADDNGVSALKELREILTLLPSAIDCPPCPTCTGIGLAWYLDQERSTLSTHDSCWRENEALKPLRMSVESIVTRYADDVTCEKNG